jgi:hypothetical protein
MKRSFSGLGFGLWVLGGIVGLYLAGAIAIVVMGEDAFFLWYAAHSERPAQSLAWKLYGVPFVWIYWR